MLGRNSIEMIPDEGSSTIVISETTTSSLDEENLYHTTEEPTKLINRQEVELTYFGEIYNSSDEENGMRFVDYWLQDAYEVNPSSYRCNLLSRNVTEDVDIKSKFVDYTSVNNNIKNLDPNPNPPFNPNPYPNSPPNTPTPSNPNLPSTSSVGLEVDCPSPPPSQPEEGSNKPSSSSLEVHLPSERSFSTIGAKFKEEEKELAESIPRDSGLGNKIATPEVRNHEEYIGDYVKPFYEEPLCGISHLIHCREHWLEEGIINQDQLRDHKKKLTKHTTPRKRRKKTRHDRHDKTSYFKKGDRVWRFDNKSQTTQGELKMHWKGPYMIEKVYQNGTIQLKKLLGQLLPKMVKGSKLKPYIN